MVKRCQTTGYLITDAFAKKWLDKYPEDVNFAAVAAKYDIDARKCYIIGERRNKLTTP